MKWSENDNHWFTMTRPVTFTQAQVRRAVKGAESAGFAQAAEDAQTFIYFVRAREFIKIGKSRHWKRRIENMQVGSPHIIVPLLVLIGPQKMERTLHNRFRADHFRGEWFHMGPAINAFIKDKLKDCVAKDELLELPKPPRKDGLAGWDEVIL